MTGRFCRFFKVLGAAAMVMLSACTANGSGVEISIRLVDDSVLDDSQAAWEFEFTATGDAVSDGTVCESGEVTTQADNTEDAVTLWLDEEGDPARLTEDRFTCSDGSGSFTLRAEFAFDGADAEPGEWSVTDGIGDYSSLEGRGTYLPPDQVGLEIGEDSGVFVLYRGELRR